MSRYHPVRPKKQKHTQAAPEPAAPAHSERLEEVAAKFYEYMGGPEIDVSIARWRKLLAVHDREVAKLADGEIEGGYRWTVSPAMAFRIDKYLHQLIERQSAIKLRRYKEAEDMLARDGRGDSLCPPKPVSDGDTATSEADAGNLPPANTGGAAEAGPIAA